MKTIKIVRKTLRDGNIYPVVYNYLNLLPEDILHHNKHNLRHPLAIYNLSLNRVISAFIPILDEIDKINTTLLDVSGKLNCDLSQLPKLQEELLESLLAHIDDCYLILKTIHEPIESNSSSQFVEHWLKEAQHPGYKKFQTGIQIYRNSLAPLVNRIKHQHGRVRSFMIYPRDLTFVAYHKSSGFQFRPYKPRIPGYYIEGIQKDGKIGADPELHPKNTAISLNRDLKYHFVHIYSIGLDLKNALVESMRKLYGKELPLPGKIPTHSNSISKIENLAERLSKRNRSRG
ncbi:MAG TPA: hypothetical protein VK203_12575 [Nostocaceae cyanobacterium]|nr:hypothetical protein [Nostocaceae cyanobacterium]